VLKEHPTPEDIATQVKAMKKYLRARQERVKRANLGKTVVTGASHPMMVQYKLHGNQAAGLRYYLLTRGPDAQLLAPIFAELEAELDAQLAQLAQPTQTPPAALVIATASGEAALTQAL
jgi:hypothetical protein